MRQILTTAIILYWTAFFGVLAGVCVLRPEAGIVEAYRLLGLTHITSTVADAGGPWLAAAFGTAFGLISLTFLWGMVANALEENSVGETDEILRMAFGGAAFALVVLLISAGILSVSGVLTTITVLLGGLAGSYVATHMERSSVANRRGAEATPGPRSIAALAARDYALHRFGQGDISSGGDR